MDTNIPLENEAKIEEVIIIDAESQPTEPLTTKDDSKTIKIKINRKVLIIVAIIVVILAALYFIKGMFIAATVNGSPISRLSVIKKLEKFSGKNLLDTLINEKLVQAEAQAKNIVITDEEINNEIKNIEAQVAAGGTTLDKALAEQKMTRADLQEQITYQKQIEALVADKINVSDEEVAKYIKDNQINIPAGQETAANTQIKAELRNQKINQAATTLLADLKSAAKIKYFVNY